MKSDLATHSVLIAIAIFVGMMLCAELGRRHALRDPGRNVTSHGGTLIDSAIFALLGLLVAFTFSGAASRFDNRRTQIVEEANSIGTAYLRLDLLPAAARDDLRAVFRHYVDERIAIYRAIPDVPAALGHLQTANRLQQEIWDKAVAGSQDRDSTRVLLLPAVNEMFDITTTRTMATLTHTPTIIFALLIGIALVSALLAGRAMASDAHRPWIRSVLYALTITATIFIIIDMEYPRAGIIRVDAFDAALVDVRAGMR